MRIALLAPGYPSPRAPHEYAFVHARAVLYRARGHEVRAFRPGEPADWVVDDIPVVSGSKDALVRALRETDPQVLAVHAPNFRTIPIAGRIACRQVSWVHGHEALFSLRRLHYGANPLARAWKVAKLIPLNVVQLLLVRAFLESQAHVVFVSRWMRKAAERHTRRRYENAVVIPNPVDTDRFQYTFDAVNRTKGISVRSFNSTKYGIDVAIRAWSPPAPGDLTVIGSGPLEASFRRLIRRTQSRVVLDVRRIAHVEMPSVLSGYGFFVAPSRVEAQGVAMCEAMACGLPIIASRVGGIPEFIDHGREGLLVPPDDVPALRGAVEALLADPQRHLEMSRLARERMERQCSPRVVTGAELALLEDRAGSACSEGSRPRPCNPLRRSGHSFNPPVLCA